MEKNYIIALYKLSNNYIECLKKYFEQKDKYKLINLVNLNSADSPTILLIDMNEKITKEIRKYCEENFVQIIRLTDKPISVITNSEIILSLSNEILKKDFLFIENKITQFEYSMNVLEKIIEQTSILKLDFINNSLILKNEKERLSFLIKLINLIDNKDNYTKKHSLNVSKYTMLLGKELGLSEEDIDLLKIGGLLHDIGKLGIPDNILMKRNSLTSTEYESIKKHPILGESMLPSEGYEEIKKMIRSHHERIDGKGYPDGLKGNDIPYFARILSIADTFDAMTTQRVYNKTKTFEEAIDELINASKGKIDENGEIVRQLDPILVDIFIKALKKDKDLMIDFRKRDIVISNMKKKTFKKG